MLQNNPNFTETQGTIKESIAQTNGLGDVKIYSDAEKNNIANPRVSDQVQKDIYELPNRKMIWQDNPFEGAQEAQESQGGAE